MNAGNGLSALGGLGAKGSEKGKLIVYSLKFKGLD